MINIDTKFILANRFTFEPNNNSLTDHTNQNEVTRLGSNESRILLLLSERSNEVISRHDLHEFVWRDQGFEVDDSSLTQAISTLRKLLKDSTKDPQFIKTVPKRGYQLICQVERAAVMRTESTELGSSAESEENTPLMIEESAVLQQPNSLNSVPTQPKISLFSKLLLLIAILLPIGVVLLTDPPESKFRTLAVYEQVPVKTPKNHPDLSEWLPSIEQCVKQHTQFNRDHEKPMQVIATGGQNNYLILNYIYSVQHSSDNKTVRIFANQKNLKKVCQ